MMVIIRGEGHKAAQVIVYDPYIKPFPCLPLQNINDRIQHSPLTKYKKFQEYIPFGAFECLQYLLEESLACGKIFGLSMYIDRESGVLLEISCLRKTIHMFFNEERQEIPRKIIKLGASSVTFNNKLPQLAGIRLEIEDDIQEPPENREH
jgi:hypothetical protein